jgi:hypothetical protein
MGRPAGAGNTGVTQGMQVRPILVDPCVYLISSADGPVAGLLTAADHLRAAGYPDSSCPLDRAPA